MKILILGNGGREHALAWKIAASSQVDQVYVAPGNAGTAGEPGVENIDIGVDDLPALVQFAKDNAIDLTIVGPEAPLVNGVVDLFLEAGLPIFGPSKAAAQLEGSKKFSKDFLARHDIPTARYASFTDMDAALTYVKSHDFPVVIKADGLAAGKGVIIAENYLEAENTILSMLAGNAFGEAGHRVVIEEYLTGEEASFIVMVDGEHILPMATSQDHKRVADGDQGPNTGGMGAYSPAAVVTDKISERIMNRIIIPTVRGMKKEGHPYVGFLYAGIMIDKGGNPYVIEFNCRFGDPETQPIMMRLESDLVTLCQAAVVGQLDKVVASWSPEVAVGVVMAAGGYPGEYQKGDVITGIETIDDPKCKIFLAGVSCDKQTFKTDGGRVLCVTALDNTLEQAQKRAYHSVKKIHWKDHFYRTDIGHRVLDPRRIKA